MSTGANDTVRVFVYGTLKDGFPLFFHEELTANRVAAVPAEIEGRLYDLGPFPALRLDRQGAVFGEVHLFKNPKETLAILDEIEGYLGPGEENQYIRREVEAILADGSKVSCYTYEYARPLSERWRIKSGRWLPELE